jgi:hypothetical protein
MALGCRPSQPGPLTESCLLLDVARGETDPTVWTARCNFPVPAHCVHELLPYMRLIITTGIIVSEAGAIRWCAIPVGMSPTTPTKET